MPKTTAPLLSFDARGQIAKTQVYSSWKGIAYARRYTVPANPRTVKQTANRAIWQLLNQAWLYAPASVQAAFNTFAVGKPLTGRNKFFSENQKLLATDPTATDLTGFVFSPGARGGLPPVSVVATPGDDLLDVAIGVPVIPSGWSVTSTVACAIVNQDPTDAFDTTFVADVETVAPGTNQITGLTGGTEYVVGGFIVWERPDGLVAYSISLTTTGTPT